MQPLLRSKMLKQKEALKLPALKDWEHVVGDQLNDVTYGNSELFNNILLTAKEYIQETAIHAGKRTSCTSKISKLPVQDVSWLAKRKAEIVCPDANQDTPLKKIKCKNCEDTEELRKRLEEEERMITEDSQDLVQLQRYYIAVGDKLKIYQKRQEWLKMLYNALIVATLENDEMLTEESRRKVL